jgi:hypothetical protein
MPEVQARCRQRAMGVSITSAVAELKDAFARMVSTSPSAPRKLRRYRINLLWCVR